MKALSLCGGGSKGAYELGAWDAFRELKMEFEIVTGASIGALNGGMMVQDDFDRCEELWGKININEIIANGIEVEEVSLRKVISHQNFMPLIIDYIKDSSSVTKPFKELMADYLKPEKIKASKIRFGITLSLFPSKREEHVIVNDLDEERMLDYLIASCSAFPFFPICKIDGKSYMDGGFADNLPIDLAFKMGATSVVAIDLKDSVHHKEFILHPCVDYIYPKWDLGSFLYFNPEVIAKNRKLGYYDTLKFYGKYDGFKYTFRKTSKYDSISQNITLTFTSDYIYFIDNKLKNYFKKDGYTNIYSILNKHIYRDVKMNDYLIKCVEEIASIYEVAPTKTFDIIKLSNKVLSIIASNDTTNLALEFSKLKNDSKRREYIEDCDKKLFLSYMYHSEYNEKFKYFLMQSFPDLYICYVYIKSL